MDLLKANYLNTTTQMTIDDGGTATIANILNRDRTRQFLTDGYNSDALTASITFSFDETLAVSRLAMINTNLKEFDIFYNGATANTFALTSTASTSTSQWTGNSATALYMRFTSVDCTSVTIDMKATQIADAEKAIAWFVLSTPEIDFEVDGRIPSANNYKPLLSPKKIEHKMSDGGLRIQTLFEKHSVELKYKYIGETFRNSLKSVYLSRNSFIFDGFGTTTGWDEFIFECVWSGKFDFFKYSDNAIGSGFSGKIKLMETTV